MAKRKKASASSGESGAPAQNGARSGTAKRDDGQRTAAHILDAATGLLVEAGYGAFSLRKVAERADVALGNLQYYFPGKADLLRALLRREFDRYGERLQRQMEDPDATARQRLDAAVAYLLADQKSQPSCAIFWELWALSAHDTDAARVMEEFYTEYRAQVTNLLLELNPTLGTSRAKRRGVLAVAMIEGLSLFRGHGKPAHRELRGIEAELTEMLYQLAQ